MFRLFLCFGVAAVGIAMFLALVCPVVVAGSQVTQERDVFTVAGIFCGRFSARERNGYSRGEGQGMLGGPGIPVLRRLRFNGNARFFDGDGRFLRRNL